MKRKSPSFKFINSHRKSSMQRWNYLQTPSEKPAVLTKLCWMSPHRRAYLFSCLLQICPQVTADHAHQVSCCLCCTGGSGHQPTPKYRSIIHRLAMEISPTSLLRMLAGCVYHTDYSVSGVCSSPYTCGGEYLQWLPCLITPCCSCCVCKAVGAPPGRAAGGGERERDAQMCQNSDLQHPDVPVPRCAGTQSCLHPAVLTLRCTGTPLCRYPDVPAASSACTHLCPGVQGWVDTREKVQFNSGCHPEQGQSAPKRCPVVASSWGRSCALCFPVHMVGLCLAVQNFPAWRWEQKKRGKACAMEITLLSIPCLPLHFVCPECFARGKLPEPKRQRNQNKQLQSNYREGLIYRRNPDLMQNGLITRCEPVCLRVFEAS